MEALKLAPGRVVVERYRVQAFLGEGGMGQVWSGIQLNTGRLVAIKVLHLSSDVDRHARARFLLEGQAACAVDHPNVVEILDFFEAPDLPPMLVMELLRGETLAAKLAREGKLSAPAMAKLFLPVLSAVGAAHSRGIIHRDLKPANIFLSERRTDEPVVKVLDFGIAKWLVPIGAESRIRTETGSLLGTPSYMAPEQAMGDRTLDHRVDVWSLGVMMYESLAGARPVECMNAAQLIMRLVRGGITPIERLVPELPHDLAQMIGRMLARDRARRPADLREVLEVIARYTDISVPAFGEPNVALEKEPEATSAEGRDGESRPPDSFGSTLRHEDLFRAGDASNGSDGSDAAISPLGRAPSNPPESGEERRSQSTWQRMSWRVWTAMALAIAAVVAGFLRPRGSTLWPHSEPSPRGVAADFASPADDAGVASLTPPPGTGPQQVGGWFKNGDDVEEFEVAPDFVVKHQGNVSGRIRSIVPRPKGFGGLMRTIDAVPYRGKRVRFSAAVKADDVRDWASLWMRVDAAERPSLAFDNMQDRPIEGTSDWTLYEVVLDVAANAEDIAFGVFIAGAGEVWIDDPKIEVVSNRVPVTDLLKKWPTPPRPALPSATADNLTFESRDAEADSAEPEATQACKSEPPASPILIGAPMSASEKPLAVTAKALTPAVPTLLPSADGGPQVLHVDVNTGIPRSAGDGWTIVQLLFVHPACLDASAFTGIQFTITGELGRCSIQFGILQSRYSDTAELWSCKTPRCKIPTTGKLSEGTTMVSFSDLRKIEPHVDPAAMLGVPFQHSGIRSLEFT